MLASTIQFTNTPPNPKPHWNHQPDPVTMDTAGDVVPGLNPDRRATTDSRLSLQDPTVCPPTTPSEGGAGLSTMFPPMSSATTRSAVKRLWPPLPHYRARKQDAP